MTVATAESPVSTSQQQRTASTRIYSWYRVLLAAVLLILFLGTDQHLIGKSAPRLFGELAVAYLALAIVQLVLISRRSPGQQQLFLVLFLDIGFLIGLTYAAGGLSSGLAPLLLVAMAAAGLLLSGQLVLLCPALATLGLLAATVQQISSGAASSQALLPTGTLGMLFFGTAISFQLLAQRLRTTQQLAQQRAADVSRLQNLNQTIVQRMRTGILVVDAQYKVKMMNRGAAELLRAEHWRRLLDNGGRPDLDQSLRDHLMHWRDDRNNVPPPFIYADTGPELITRFTPLEPDRDGDTLVFVEDAGQLAQRAQQLKLAALGRLTASIAHEIRNPLGAVSHGAQLLLESAALEAGDRRLADIVQHQSRRMNGIIESILQLSRRSPPQPRRIELREWLRTFLVDYRQGCADCELDVDSSAPLEATVDADQLSQVLTNLLDNALRHGEQRTGRRHAALRLANDGQGLPQLDIVDDGDGVPASDREKIFEPFFTTERKGSGLGLYIARELCEINQARLNYTRVDNRSCFRISFSHPDRRPLVHTPLSATG